jgi:MFS family permease
MQKTKFSGWQQVILVALTTGFGVNLFSQALNIANAAMFSQGQIVMSASMFGLAYSLYSLTQGPPQLLVGKLVRKFGSRTVLIAGFAALVLLGFGISNFIRNGALFVAIYTLHGLMSVTINQIAPQTLINSWFHQHRGRAQSILRAIASLLTMVAPICATFVITNFGKGNFKAGWYLGGAGAAIALVFALFAKNNPQLYGETPDGIEAGAAAEDKKGPEKKAAAVSTVYKRPIGQDIEYAAALKTLIFWFMAAASSIGFLCLMTVAFNSVYYISIGASLETISLALGVGSAINIAFAFAMSTFIDRIEPGFVLGGIFLLFGVNAYLTAMPAGSFVIYTQSVLVSVLGSGTMAIMPIMYANYFGNKAFPQIQGLSLLMGGLLSSATGIVGGIIADATGSYSTAYVLFGSFALVAAVLCIFVVGLPSRRKYKNEAHPAVAA